MFVPLASILVVVSILLGGTGATVVAAQSSLPDQPLYGVKILSEDARLKLATSAQNELQVELEFANRRIEEIRNLLEKGVPPQEAVLTRLQNQLDQALRLAAGLDEDQVVPALEHIRLELQNQEQALVVLQAKASLQAEPVLAQARQMIQSRLQLAENGLGDPQTFRRQFRQQGPSLYGVTPTRRPQTTPAGFGPGPSATGAPGNGYGPGPGANPTAQPGSGNGYGPGPHITGTPTPGSGYGPGPNPTSTPVSTDEASSPTQPPASGNGPGPYVTGTPTPGSGYGPGPGPEPGSTCTPQAGPGGPQGPGGGKQP